MDKVLKLEQEMEKLNDSLVSIEDILAKLNENIKKLNIGIYGDKENDHIGVIERQRQLEDRIFQLEKKLRNQEDNDRKEQAIIVAKKDLKVNWWNIIKWVAGFIGQGVIWYLIFKGILQPTDGLK
jgi:predicted nuclease with TOPRIM domain